MKVVVSNFAKARPIFKILSPSRSVHKGCHAASYRANAPSLSLPPLTVFVSDTHIHLDRRQLTGCSTLWPLPSARIAYAAAAASLPPTATNHMSLVELRLRLASKHSAY